MLKPDGTFQQDIQCIVPQQNNKGAIYISNLQAASNPQTLKRHKIGAVITAIRGKNLSQIIPKHIQYFYIPVIDHQSCDISVYFKDSYQFIQEERKRTNVLVHCMAGVSRSVTLVIAYIMEKSQINYQTAYNYVKSKRNIIHPNQSFIQQLKKLQTQLKLGSCRKQQKIQKSQVKQKQKQKQKIYKIQLQKNQLKQISNNQYTPVKINHNHNQNQNIPIKQHQQTNHPENSDNKLSKSIYLSTGASQSFTRTPIKTTIKQQSYAQQKISYSLITNDKNENNKKSNNSQNCSYDDRLRQNIKNLFTLTKSQIKLLSENNQKNKVYR